MSDRKVIRQFTLDSAIWDADLPQKVATALAASPIVIEPQIYYAIDVVFDYRAYGMPEFYTFKLDKPLPEKKYPKRCNDEEERRKELISAILSQQLDRVLKAISKSELDICHSGIIGEDRPDPHTVDILLYEDKAKEYDRKGRLVHTYRVSSIVPNRPWLLDRAVKVLADMFLKDYQEKLIKEAGIAAHKANMVSADTVFRKVAEAVLLDIRMSKEKRSEAVTLLSNTLRLHASVKTTWPLEIAGQNNEKPLSESMAPGYEIDCPAYMLYREHKNGAWTLKRIADLSEAQRIVTQDGYNLKSISCIAVLHYLNPVRFSLFAETESGLLAVKRTEAANHKKLNLCWEKSR